MRALWLVLHRGFGLFMVAFLVVSGLTGAVISWDHEIDEWLNAGFFETRSSGTPRPPLELAARIEAADSRVRVTFVPLQHEPGRAAVFGVQPRVNAATGRLHEAGYNQVFVDPVSGERLGQRESGAVSLSRENLMPFLYKLHYSLHIPELWGIDRWGVWLMGIVALIWLLDSFIGFYLTLPRRRSTSSAAPLPAADVLVAGLPLRERDANDRLSVRARGRSAGKTYWQRWKPAWRIKWRASAARVNFDVHRAFGLWTWALVFLIAFTAFSLNLYKEVFWPVLTAVSSVTPGPFDVRERRPLHDPIAPKQSFAEVIELAKAEAQRRGWPEPVGNVFYAQHFGVYGVGFFEPGNDHGSGGMGVKRLYYDGAEGRSLGSRVPWEGTAADIFVQLQFPVHSGRILGMPGRILMSIMGLVVAVLSVTGVVIWARKRRVRHGADQRGTAAVRMPRVRDKQGGASPAGDGRGAV